jgi:hypothetical protein
LLSKFLNHKTGIFFFTTFFLHSLFSCNNKQNKYEEKAHEIELNLKVIRFDTELLTCKNSKDTVCAFNLKNKYSAFSNLYFNKIIQLGTTNNPLFYERTQSFLNDNYISQVYNSCNKEFSNIADFETELTQSFKIYKAMFPKKYIPTLYTYVGGFNYSAVSADSILAIGLDMYLNNTNQYYTKLNVPDYLIRKMRKEFMLRDALYSWVSSEFEPNTENENLLSKLLYNGKVLYIIKQLVPNIQDSILFGYSQQQLNWVTKNELEIWKFAIQKKLLFENNPTNINRYLAESPFTPGLERQSPGQTYNYIAFRIIESYLKNNSKETIEKIIFDNNAQKILNKSKYKP